MVLLLCLFLLLAGGFRFSNILYAATEKKAGIAHIFHMSTYLKNVYENLAYLGKR